MTDSEKVVPSPPRSAAGFLDILMVIVPILMLGRFQESFPFLWPLRLVLVLSIIMVLAMLVNKGLTGPRLKLLTYSVTFKWFAAFVVMMGLSTIWSIYQGRTFSFVVSFLQFVGVFLLFLNCQVKNRDKLKYVLIGSVITVVLLSLICFIKPRYVDGRVTANMSYDPNDVALFFIMILALTLPAVQHIKAAYRKWMYLAAAMGLGAIILTQSRGGLVAMVVTLVVWALSKGIKGVARLILLGMLGLAIVIAVVPAEKLSRFGTLADVEDDYNMTAKHGRIDVWKNGLELFGEHFLLGTGASTFMVAEGQTHAYGKWSEAHNAHIEVGVELGLPGLLIYWGMLLSAYRRAKPRSPDDWLGTGIRLSLVAFMAGGMFLSWGFHFVLFYVLSIAMVRERVLRMEAIQAERGIPTEDVPIERPRRDMPSTPKRHYKMRVRK